MPRRVDPLTWNGPIVDSQGFPTLEFHRKWLQQHSINAGAGNVIVIVVSAQGALAAGEVLPGVTSTDAITFSKDMAYSGYAKTAPTASATITFKKYPGGASVATATFIAGSNKTIVAVPATFTLGPGEAIYPAAPSPADATLADVVVAWKGSLA